MKELHDECERAPRTPSTLADTDTPDIIEYEHVDPGQVAESELVASQAETDASLAKQAALSKFQAAQQEAAAAEQHIAEEALGHQAEMEAEIRVEDEKAAELKSKVATAKKSPEKQQHRTEAAESRPRCVHDMKEDAGCGAGKFRRLCARGTA